MRVDVHSSVSAAEFHQPVKSFKRMAEAMFLYSKGMSPYASHTFFQPPLTLALFLAPAQHAPQGYAELVSMVCLGAGSVWGCRLRGGMWVVSHLVFRRASGGGGRV